MQAKVINKTCKCTKFVYIYLYNNQINARALIGQSAVGYCAGKPRKNHASSELLYKSNRPQASVGYRLINHLWDVGRTLEEFVNHSPAARGLRILVMFYQHPAWFISL